ncbi:single-stranded DNA-binding protein [Gordonia sp. PP30]|uniref:single-stranded DNA-binding protein n=1 Tax=unclassified Gordonia (in: high G+C Gram-positive bacteria) TaxID=2657482 RepID=UPI001FFF9F9A|nr:MULTISPECIES: single-stranded DNA-binding protein [unclassified Gordonia (in: high G+C Gram-positive bacteria)]UQE76512.1 single-stranded DNA-binding protein [Gordonia sp. PP30]
MYETYTTITGRVVSDPRRYQTSHNGEVVSFRVACFSRRLDRETGQWSDGAALYLTVVCWRRLAASVADVVRRGSQIIAHGQLRTNEYVGSDGVKRSDLEMVAVALGLDLGHHQPDDRGPLSSADAQSAPADERAGEKPLVSVMPTGPEPAADSAVAGASWP